MDSELLPTLFIAGFLGFGIDPILEIFWKGRRIRQHGKLDQDGEPRDASFDSTYLHRATVKISTAARIFGVLLIGDLIHSRFPMLMPLENLRAAAPGVAFTVWFALVFCSTKRAMIARSTSTGRLGRIELYDRLIDFVVAVVTMAMILDQMAIDIGVGLQSVFAAGGMGALIFSLASRGLAEQIVGGLMVSMWDAIAVGDVIHMGDGTDGVITKIGLVDLEVRGFDNIVTRIPNSQVVNQRVSNLSRVTVSQVKETLRFNYSDLSKLPKVLDDIKEEIKMSCDKLISDGSKAFFALLTKYESDHVQAVVNTHFNIPPATLDNAKNRQQVILAIARAMEKNGVEFALPAIQYHTSQQDPAPIGFSAS